MQTGQQRYSVSTNQRSGVLGSSCRMHTIVKRREPQGGLHADRRAEEARQRLSHVRGRHLHAGARGQVVPRPGPARYGDEGVRRSVLRDRRAGHRARSGPQPALAGAHRGGALPLRRHDAAVPERLVQPADHERVRRGRRGRLHRRGLSRRRPPHVRPGHFRARRWIRHHGHEDLVPDRGRPTASERAQVLCEQRRVRPLYIGGRHRQGRGGYGPLPVAVLLARAPQRARHQRRAHQQDRPVHAALRAHLLRRCGAVAGVAPRCE